MSALSGAGQADYDILVADQALGVLVHLLDRDLRCDRLIS